jgi:hypothetical protein
MTSSSPYPKATSLLRYFKPLASAPQHCAGAPDARASWIGGHGTSP